MATKKKARKTKKSQGGKGKQGMSIAAALSELSGGLPQNPFAVKDEELSTESANEESESSTTTDTEA